MLSRIRLLPALVVLFLSHSAPVFSQAINIAIEPGDGVEFFQLDYLENTPPVPDSTVGLLRVNVLELRGLSGLDSGFVNVVIDNNWVVQNMVVLPQADFPYPQLATQLDLGVIHGTDVTSVDAEVLYSNGPFENAPFTPSVTFTVGDYEIDLGGVDGDSGVAGGGVPSPPVVIDFDFGGLVSIKSVTQLDHPNIEAAVNQCYPMSVANSLKYLENTTNLSLPHNHVAGLKGDDSLVGQLGEWMNRTVTDRLNGSGVHRTPGLEGKLKYLADNDLQDRVVTRHWGNMIQNSDVTVTVNGKTAKSLWQSQKFTQLEMEKALARGEDCEAIYSWPAGSRDGKSWSAGAHAVDLVAAGSTNGVGWITEASDVKQKSDTEGAGASGFVSWNLNDPDGDGYFNLNGSIIELDTLICEKVIPASIPPWTPPPPPLWLENVEVRIVDIIDPLDLYSSLLPEERLPPFIELHLELPTTHNDVFHIGGNAQWLPLVGPPPTPDGRFQLQGLAPFGGMVEVEIVALGLIAPDVMSGRIIIGTRGELQGNVPIEIIFEAFPPGPPGTLWPWIDPPVALPPQPIPIIRVNGERDFVQLPPFEPFSIQLGLDADGLDTFVDFFLVAQLDQQFFYFDLASNDFLPGLLPTAQGQLQDIPNLPILTDLGGLPPLDAILYFGFDDIPNGLLDPPALLFDHIELQVQPKLPLGP